jgi:pimeloyl-ACP methyl ester carboxylesterase
VLRKGPASPKPRENRRVAGTWQDLGTCLLGALLAFSHAAAHEGPPSGQLSPSIAAEELLAQAASSSSNNDQQYRARRWLRAKVVCDDDLARYGLRFDDKWQRAPAEQPVIILVHGFNSSPDQNVGLLKPICEATLPCGTFAYPNDHLIVESAQLLSSELRRFAQCYPGRRIILVCHSMGSLVARLCLEDPLYDPGNVDRLIMIAPPNHGSMLAHFAVSTDLWEHWIARRRGGPWKRVRDSIVDGLGEAADDLCPGSPFLTELNSRPLNPCVRYTILLGTGARINDAQLTWIRESVCDSLAKVPGGGASADRLAELLNNIDELVEGKGDGVVAVKRGRLDGVSDTLVMPFGHIAVTGEPRDDVLRDVQREVLERLQ